MMKQELDDCGYLYKCIITNILLRSEIRLDEFADSFNSTIC